MLRSVACECLPGGHALSVLGLPLFFSVCLFVLFVFFFFLLDFVWFRFFRYCSIFFYFVLFLVVFVSLLVLFWVGLFFFSRTDRY